MLPKPQNYAVYPTVVQTKKETCMVIAPTERAFLLVEGETYTVTIIGVNNDELSYHHPMSYKHVEAVANGGVLKFNYSFDVEQEYLLILKNSNGDKKAEIKMYAVDEDLFALKPLRGDFHSHSFRSDGSRDVSAHAGHYREMGYDFCALTDHNRFYPGGEMDEVYAGVDMDYKRVTGEEVHTPGSIVHIVHVGGKKSVAEQYIHQREQYEKDVMENYLPRVPKTVAEDYKLRYARAMWATDKIHEAGGLAIFAHPYWRTSSRVYNVNDEFARIMLKSGMFDAFELIGGMGYDGVNRAVNLLTELRAQGVNIPIVGSSDVHEINKDYTYPDFFTVCFAKENENDAIIESVKNNMSVAVQAIGVEYARNYYCYGSVRLVSYASFLLKDYFDKRQRVCQNEGVAMRAFAMEEVGKELIEIQCAYTRDWTDRYFGKKPPVLPSKTMLDFEDKWRATHVKVGPPTKGSSIDGNNRQI